MPEPAPPVADPVRLMLAGDRASAALGIEVDSASEGHAVARLKIRTDMVNGHNIAHGGVIFTLADTAFACACNSWGPVTVAAGAEITFIRPARLGEELVAEAQVRTRFGRHGLYDVTVRTTTGVVAEFRGRSSATRTVPR